MPVLSAAIEVKTLRPIHPNDPNEFVMVGSHNVKVATNFTAKEFYNPKNGLAEHPISVQIIECCQFLRDYFGRPIKISSSYRNYVPKDPDAVKHSTHQYAEAADLIFRKRKSDQFLDEEINEEIIMVIRQDWNEKGEIFQGLWARGCRGIGFYDDIIHIDTVPTEVYDYWRKRRIKNKYQGKYFGYWDSTKKLRLLTPMGILNQGYVLIKPPTVSQKVEKEVLKAAGSVVGFWKDITTKREDDHFQADEVNVGYAIAFIIGIALVALFIFLLVKRYIL